MRALQPPGYDILQRIGAGRAGEVFRAREQASGRTYALKASHRVLPHSSEHVAFRFEYHLLSTLRHPHIIRAHAFGETEEPRWYYTMDYVPATASLGRVFAAGGYARLAEAARCICDALAYVHGQGILHGDLKPANILISLDESGGGLRDLRLGDFGLAERLSGGETERLKGSLLYLSPEQMMGWPADPRSDLFSLGVALYEAVSGRAPFADLSPRELVRVRIRQRAASLHTADPLVPRDWSELLDDLMAPSPGDRPLSAREVAKRLEALSGEGDRLPAPQAAEPACIGASLDLVGRDEILGRLRDRLHAGGSAVLLTGDEGVGKTRVLDALAREVALDGGVVVHAGSTGVRGGGFDLLHGIWHAPAEGPGWGSGGQGREFAFERTVAALLPPHGPAEGGEKRLRLLVFDSIESADADSLDFLAVLCRRTSESRGMLLMAARPAAKNGALDTLRAAGAEEMAVEPLAREHQPRLLASLLGASPGGARTPPLDEDSMARLAAWVEEAAGGNPRLMESALAELVRSGHLRRAAPEWTLDLAGSEPARGAARAGEIALRRIDGLGAALRPLLETASVLGDEFAWGHLSAVDPSGGEASIALLGEGLRRGILRAAPHRDGSLGRVAFADPALRRALYRSLPEARRRALHAVIAHHLADSPFEEGAAAAIARHFRLAGERASAVAYGLQAAQQNHARCAFKEASRLFAEAWEDASLEERREAGPSWVRWVYTRYLDGDPWRAATLADEILEALELTPSAAPARDVERHLLILKAVSINMAGEARRARELLEELLRARESREGHLESWAFAELGLLDLREGRYEPARSHLLHARAIAQREGSGRLAGLAEFRLGIVAWRMHDVRAATSWHGRALDTLIAAGAEELLPAVWGNIAFCQWQELRTAEAIRHHRLAAEGYAALHRRLEAARCYQNLASALVDLGRADEAEKALADADRWGRTIRGPVEESYFAYARGRLAQLRGQMALAKSHAEAALAHARTAGDAYVEYGPMLLLSEVAHELKQGSEAEHWAREAIRTSEGIGDAWGISDGQLRLAQAARARGDRVGAAEHATIAADRAEAAQIPTVLLRARLLLAELVAAAGERERALETLASVRRMLSGAGSALWSAELRLAEGNVYLALGEEEHACPALVEASRLAEEMGASSLRAVALERLGQARVRLGHRAAGRSAQAAARRIRRLLGLPHEEPEEAPAAGEGSGSRRELQALAAVGSELVDLRGLEQVLDKVLEITVNHLGAERGVVALVNAVTGELEVRRTFRFPRDIVPEALEISRGALALAREGRMVCVPDALADPALSTRASVRRYRIRSLAAVPLVWRGEVLGVLYVDHREFTDLFGPNEEIFLRFIADMTAVGIRNAREMEVVEARAEALRGALEERDAVSPGTVASSQLMQAVLRRAMAAARSEAVVFLTGASGVGKDHIARLIHAHSGRKGEFVHCALLEIPETLVESELFGVNRGAATGVIERLGLAGEADGGTLFLDEVADLSPQVQAKLLRLVDERRYRRVGGGGELTFHGQIVCATNGDMERLVAERKFRADLFYRISQVAITVPSLEERPEDIPELLDLFLRRFSHEAGRRRLVLAPEAFEELRLCPWEGNVRELASCLQQAVILAEADVIETRHLDCRSLRRWRASRAAGGPEPSGVRDELDLVLVRRVRDAMERSGGIMTRAALELGVSEATLRRWIRKANLEHLAVRRRPL